MCMCVCVCVCACAHWFKGWRRAEATGAPQKIAIYYIVSQSIKP